MRPIVFIQRRTQQVDAPVYRELTRRGVDCHVVIVDLEVPIDPEIGVQPQFGDTSTGYRVLRADALHVPDEAHIVVAGWDGLRSWRWLARAGIRRGATVGIRFDFVQFPGTPAPRAISRVRSGAALRLADVWHPTGELGRASAERLSGTIRPSIAFPYVSDHTQFKPRVARTAPGPLKVLAVSKLNQRENIEVLIRAVERLPATDFHLDIVGDGPLRGELMALANRAGVSAAFHGYVPYALLPTHYASADVFVHPSEREVWGVSIQEAMLSGLPVIASNRVGAAIELLDRDTSEWQFMHSDPEDLATKLRAMQDPWIRSRHSSRNVTSVRRASASSVSDALCAYLSGENDLVGRVWTPDT